jgi:hypothetical protein
METTITDLAAEIRVFHGVIRAASTEGCHEGQDAPAELIETVCELIGD